MGLFCLAVPRDVPGVPSAREEKWAGGCGRGIGSTAPVASRICRGNTALVMLRHVHHLISQPAGWADLDSREDQPLSREQQSSSGPSLQHSTWHPLLTPTALGLHLMKPSQFRLSNCGWRTGASLPTMAGVGARAGVGIPHSPSSCARALCCCDAGISEATLICSLPPLGCQEGRRSWVTELRKAFSSPWSWCGGQGVKEPPLPMRCCWGDTEGLSTDLGTPGCAGGHPAPSPGWW